MEINYGVITCLYGGIHAKIEFVKTCMKHFDDKMINQYISEISDALAFYQAECIVSGALLKAEFEELVTLVAVREVNANEAKGKGIDCAAGTVGEL